MTANNLRRYVFTDNQRRRRDDRLSLLIAFAASTLGLVLGSSERDAAFIGLIVLGAAMACFTMFYCSKAPLIEAYQRAKSSTRGLAENILYRPVSRRLAWISGVALVLLGAFPTRELESSIVDKRLRQALSGEITPEKIEETGRVIDQARTDGLRASPKTLSVVGQKLIDAARTNPKLASTALSAASDIAGYKSLVEVHPGYTEYRVETNLRTMVLPEATGRSGVVLSAMKIGTPPRPGKSAWWRRDGDTQSTSNAERVIIGVKYLPPGGFIALDNSDIRNLTFLNANFLYTGKPLKLENVEFVNCRFNVRDSSIEEMHFLSAVLSQSMVTLALP